MDFWKTIQATLFGVMKRKIGPIINSAQFWYRATNSPSQPASSRQIPFLSTATSIDSLKPPKMSFDSSRSANSGSKSKRSSDSNLSNNNKKRKQNENQKTLGMAWGSNSLSSSKSSSRRSNFPDFGSYMAVKNRKLHDQFDAEASTSLDNSSNSGSNPLFHGVSIFVDGFTVPSSQELKSYMLKYGGRFENYFSRSRVTHIICSNLPDSKVKNIRSFSRGLPVVKPTWVLDSVAANKLLNWVPYQLDQLVNDIHKQPKLSSFFVPKSTSLEDAKTPANLEANVGEDSSPKGGTFQEAPLCEIGESIEYSFESNKEISQEISCDEIKEEPMSAEEEVSESKMPKSITFDSNLEKGFESSPCKSSASANDSLLDKNNEKSSSLQIAPGSNQGHSTLGDPNFVENYFKNSRLHFIGTWRSRYRKRFPSLPSGIKTGISAADTSTIPQGTAVIHVDMDCFFVSVIIRNLPELQDKPVAICHSDNPRGTAEISSANYPARDYGVKAGMFVRDAKARCPHLVILPYNFQAYEVVADQFYHILHKHCNKVQAVSCDEAFLDVRDREGEDAEHIASVIRQEIYEATGCTASAGIAGNLLMARLATRTAKPNGQFLIPPEKVEDFLQELPIKALPGIGHALQEKLKKLQIQTCGQLRMTSKELLQKNFGPKTGMMLWNYSRGIDSRPVGVIQETKSVGAEVNWGVRFNTMQDSLKVLEKLCNEVSLRLKGGAVQGRTITLKLKKKRKDAAEPAKYMGCGDCENLSHSMTIPSATDDADILQKTSKQLFGYFHIDVKDIRGIGVQVSRLENADKSSQGQERNSLRSWLSSASASMDDPLLSSRGRSERDVSLLDGQCSTDSMKLGKPNPDGDSRRNPKPSPGSWYQGHINQSSAETSVSRGSTLPDISDLDMGVLENLPPEILSEVNEMYGGKLSSFLKRNEDEHYKKIDSVSSPLLREVEDEEKATHPSDQTHAEQITNKDKVEQCQLQEYQSASTSVVGTLNSHQATVGEDQSEFMPTSFSQIDISVLQQLPEEVKADILGLLPSHNRPTSSDSCLVKRSHDKEKLQNVTDHVEGEDSVSRSSIWFGHPPKWVEQFEVSNHTLLNLLADLYYKSGLTGLLSSILQSAISVLPIALDASNNAGNDLISSLSDLLQQYIDIKIQSDIEEIYVSFRLLKRFTEKSKFFLQVYEKVLPHLQASFAENYGGNLNL